MQTMGISEIKVCTLGILHIYQKKNEQTKKKKKNKNREGMEETKPEPRKQRGTQTETLWEYVTHILRVLWGFIGRLI